MDDKIKDDENQIEDKPIFKTEAVDSTEDNQTEEMVEGEKETEAIEDNVQPEELSPDVDKPPTPEDELSPSLNDGSNEALSPPPPTYEEDTKKKSILIGGAVILLFIFILILKLVFSGKKSKNVILNYWGLWEDKEAIQPLIESYQGKFPNVKIVYKKMDPQNYREKLIARSKNKQGPDIFRFHNTWLPEIKEIVSPLPQSIMSNAEFEKTFYKVHQDDLKVGKYYYGIPLEVDGLVLVVNNGLFSKANISAPPSTWEDFIDDATQMTVKDKQGNIITSGAALGTASNIEHFSEILGLFFVQNGTDISHLDSEEASGALESYRKFAEEPQNFWDSSMPNSLTAFIQEKVGMIIIPSWQILTIKAINPDIDIKVFKVPTVPGTKTISLSSYWVEGVSRFGSNQLEAWKFLEFLSKKENMTKLYQNQSKLRLFGEPYSRVDLGKTLIQNEYIGPVIEEAPNFVSQPLVGRTYDNGLNDEIIKYLENAVNSTIQGVSYGESLSVAKKGIDQVYSKFSIQ